MEDLKIKLKVEQMIQYGYSAVRQFPKSERHVLSAEIRESMYRLLRLVIVGKGADWISSASACGRTSAACARAR